MDAAAHRTGQLENKGSAISAGIRVRPLISAPFGAMRRRYMQAPPSTRRIFPVTQAASSDAR